MKRRKRATLFCIAALGLAAVLWQLWLAKAPGPLIRLPRGVSLARALRDGKSGQPKGWATNIYCLRASSTLIKDLVHSPKDLAMQRLRLEVQARVLELRGRLPLPGPNPPEVDYLTPRLGECSYASGEKYLLAKELFWEVDEPAIKASPDISLCFVWGSTNGLGHARDRTLLIEEGIVSNGIFGARMAGGAFTELFLTNQCAIIRDTRKLVKIVPLDCLRAYADAGLVRLPATK